ncbi:MAG TPA: thiamine pyrophosphate-dependent enzyme, partial [Actinomycetota bacterium]|nr:thiamine pyrophosphate-dependent enzyme [Actinomycetota bacterium]
IPTLVDLAMKSALADRTVSHITFPVDLQESNPESTPWEGGLGVARRPESSASYLGTPGVPAAEALRQAAGVLNEGERIVVLAGAGALGAGAEVLEVAELLAGPIVKTLPGKASVPDAHPLVAGGIGLLGTRPSEDAMEQCDTLLMVGTNFPYTRFLPEDARVVQIDREPKRIGNRLDVESALPGDAKQTLSALAPLLNRRADRSFLEQTQAAIQRWRQDMRSLEDPNRTPIAPQYLMGVVDRLADDDAVLCADSGTVATWAARHFEIRGDRAFYLSSNLASMACAVPYANAIQVAYPGRQCLAFVGDGGFAMLMAEFMTAVRNELPVKVIVNNNGSLGQILWEQMSLGYPEMGVRFERPLSFAPWAEACGGLGIRVEDPSEVEPAVGRALAHPGPALVDVVVNPDEPPMPAKVTYDQARGFVESFLRGQPRRAAIASTLFRDKITKLG